MARLLKNWLSSYMERVRHTEPSPRFHMWTATMLVAAALGRKCWLTMGPETVYPNLYTVLIGPPGVRKGSAMRYGMQILRGCAGIKITMAPKAVTKEQFIEKLETAKEDIMIDGRMYTHSSLLVVAEELVVFMGENDHKRMGDLCELYDCPPLFDKETKTSGINFIVNPAVWLFAATTPNWVEVCMPQLAVGGGMTSRTIFVYSHNKGKHISFMKMQPFDSVLEQRLISDLAEISMMHGEFQIHASAKNTYDEWYEKVYPDMDLGDQRLASFGERLPLMVVKLAMVLSAAKRESQVVHGEDIVTALSMFKDLLPDMPRAFGSLGYNVLGAQTEMVRQILREKKRVARSYILRKLHMHINEFDYQRIRIVLIHEKFAKPESGDDGEQYLVIVEEDTHEVQEEETLH